MAVDNVRVQEVADELRGTCLDPDTVWTEAEFANLEFLQELDTIVMRCDSCSWWVDADELDDNQDCEDCQKEDTE